jgi:hypothetical protein
MSEGDASRRRSHVDARSIKTEADVAPIASRCADSVPIEESVPMKHRTMVRRVIGRKGS